MSLQSGERILEAASEASCTQMLYSSTNPLKNQQSRSVNLV